MKLLLDTHVLLWFFLSPEKLSGHARALVEDIANEVFFSPIAVYEIAVKHAKRRPDFDVNLKNLLREVERYGLIELPLRTLHSVFVQDLAPIHKDPFDRLLLAQAAVEGALLLTADGALLSYIDNVFDVR